MMQSNNSAVLPVLASCKSYVKEDAPQASCAIGRNSGWTHSFRKHQRDSMSCKLSDFGYTAWPACYALTPPGSSGANPRQRRRTR